MAEWTFGAEEQLKQLYITYDVTSDELIKNVDKLSEFTRDLNLALGQKPFDSKEVAAKLLKLRKSKKLPRIRN